jgi:hypothetical protein
VKYLLGDYPLIWCSNCQKANPLQISEMAADEVNKTAAADLMCFECKLVIATLHWGEK